jgi:hypothetical protein
MVFDGTNWNGPFLVQNVGMSFSPSAVVFNGLLHVFHEGISQNQQLWVSWYNQNTWNQDVQVPGIVIVSPVDYRQQYEVDPMSPAAVVYRGGCYVFYLNADQNLSYKVAGQSTGWSPEAQVPNGVPSQCGYVGCVAF